MLADKYHQFFIISYFFHRILITKVIWTVNNIFWPVSHISKPFQKRFFLISNVKRRFYLKFLQNISQKLLEQCNCSLSPLYFRRSKEAIILYSHFICECIDSYLLKPFALLWNSLHLSLLSKLWYFGLVRNYSDIRKYRVLAKFVKKGSVETPFSV